MSSDDNIRLAVYPSGDRHIGRDQQLQQVTLCRAQLILVTLCGQVRHLSTSHLCYCNMTPGFISLTPRRISRNVDASRSASNLLDRDVDSCSVIVTTTASLPSDGSRYESSGGLGWWSCDVDDVECWVSCLSADVPWTAGRVTSVSPSVVLLSRRWSTTFVLAPVSSYLRVRLGKGGHKVSHLILPSSQSPRPNCEW